MRNLRVAVWAGGAALSGAILVGMLHGDLLPPGEAVVSAAVLPFSTTVGLLVWERRPESRTGILMTAAAFAGALSQLNTVFPRSAPAVTIGLAAILLEAPIVALLILSYPTGRLTSRLDRAFILVVWTFVLAYTLPYLLFYSPRAPHDPHVWDCPSCALPFTHVAWYDVTGTTLYVLDRILFVLLLVFVVLLVRKLVRASRSARRVVLPLVAVMVLAGARWAVQLGLIFVGSNADPWTNSWEFWAETLVAYAIPLVLAAGLLWGRSGRAAVADLVVELEWTPPGSVRDALARTLGDPSLELALWLPGRAAYVDGDGRPFELPAPGSDRAVTVLGPAEAPVAALVHDPALLERRSLLAAAGAAARLALENERLQAELRAQLAELRASRARIITAGDEERRRLERDLHDGAQQRLLALGLALQLARDRLGPEANGTAELLTEADGELRAALDDLRRLAHGIHPAVLTEQGLDAALKTLAERAPIPVTIADVPAERLPGPAEAAAYFLVSEALANVAKYAHASRARVSVKQQNRHVLVDVDDDGAGGADPGRGSGLRGLSDRVQALDGRFELSSPPGQGTHLHAEIPCG